MRISTSGLMAGMAALLMGAAQASAEAAEKPQPQGEGDPEAAPAESAPGEVLGSVKQASAEGIRVAVRGAPDVHLNMKPRTIVVVNGQMATVNEIRKGDNIRALYRDVQGQPLAIMLDVTGPERPPTPRFE